jgi:hypothetical protein
MHQTVIGLIVLGVGLIAASSYWNGTTAYSDLLAKRVDSIVPLLLIGDAVKAELVDDECDRTLKDYRNFFYVSHLVAVLVFLLALVVVWCFYLMCKRDKMMTMM